MRIFINICALVSFFILALADLIELDYNLVPRKLEDINSIDKLDTGEKKPTDTTKKWKPKSQLVKKYHLQNGTMKTVLQHFQKARTEEDEQPSNITYEAVIGIDDNVWYDNDWGFFSAVLAAYNNHWVLKTSPDDWWNVIVRNVAQAVDDKGNRRNVRRFFVTHKGKKKIIINIGSTFSNLNYDWLFSEFSQGIKKNVRKPGYVDLIQADFSTTSPQQLVTTQIMLMASVQKYFEFEVHTLCGIPGVDITGTEEDWVKLGEKLDKLENILKPIMRTLGLAGWFKTTRKVVSKLLDTYRGNPDKEWWGHVLSWNEIHGSGAREWWSGWMTEFVKVDGKVSKPKDFPRGIVSVPMKMVDGNNLPPVEDTGILVAGTVGFTVEETGKTPAVAAKQGWTLLLPVGSPMTSRLLGK